MKNKTSKYIASIVIFLLFLTLFLYVNFPTDVLKRRVIAEIESNSGFKAEMEDLNISPFVVMNLKKLKLTNEQDEIEILIDRLKISPSLISLLMENNRIPFYAQLGEGKIEGTIVYSGNTQRLNSFKTKLKNVNSRIVNSLLKNKKGIPQFDGEVSGEVDIRFLKNGVEDASGMFNLYSENFSISRIKIENFPLPDYKGLKAALEGKIEKNKTHLGKLQLENNDFNLILDGTMPLPWKMRGGMLDLSVNLVLNSNEAKIGFLQTFMKKKNDGSLTAKIEGPFSKPQFIKGETL